MYFVNTESNEKEYDYSAAHIRCIFKSKCKWKLKRFKQTQRE